MRKIIFVSIMGLLQTLGANSQTEIELQIQGKIKEAIDLVSTEIIDNPEDIILIRPYNSDGFYKVSEYKDRTLIAFEVLPPKIDHIKSEGIEINKDSVSDVIWIKKKKFQSLKLSNSENPFDGINLRFPSKTFERLQPEINQLTKQDHLNKMKTKYPNLKVIIAGDLHQAYFQLSKDVELISVPIHYPHKAREKGTQGMVELGYIQNEDYSISDLKVFKHLKDGCSESVLTSIEELNNKLKAKGYENNQKIYIETSVIFRLN